MPYAIDLFCGAGGMSEGLIQAGFHILFSSDINEDVQKTYMNRHKQLGYIQGENTFFHRCDIRELTGEFICNSIAGLKMFEGKEMPHIDAIFGGPPCQGFSRAGLRKKDDPRNLLFKEYLRVISEVSPDYVVMENVVGLLDMQFDGFEGLSGKKYKNGSLTPDILKNELAELEYKADMQVLDASDFGVPQRRKRVIFIAHKNDKKAPKFPTPSKKRKSITLDDAISDLAGRKRNNNYKYTNFQKEALNGRTPNIKGKTIPLEGDYLNNELPSHSEIISERFSLYKEGEDSANIKKRIKEEGISLEGKEALIQHCAKELKIKEKKVIELYKSNVTDEMIDVLMTKKNMRRRLDRNTVSPTVVTLPDDYISPYADRTFSVRELARLQSFDDSFEFLGKRTTGGPRRRVEVPQYSQVGNAVPPLLAKVVAEEIKKVL